MKFKLMIVDDSRVSRMMIENKIKTLQPEWEIFEAATGDEALALLPTVAPDFITMDVNMPGMNGFEAAERIRGVNKTVKLVMLTANIQESSRNKASALGIHFIQKPVTAAAMHLAINFFLAPQ